MRIKPLLLTLAVCLPFMSCNTQKEPLPPILTLDSTEESISAQGGNVTISYTLENPIEGAELILQSDESWIIGPDIVDNHISFEVEANPETSAREGKITVQYPKLSENPTITVKQEGGTAITLEKDAVAFTADGGDAQVKYEIVNPEGNEAITATCEQDWIEIDLSYENTIRIVCKKNEVTEERSAKVLVNYLGAEEKILEINQAAAVLPFNLEVKDITKSGLTINLTPQTENISYLLQVAPNRAVANCKTDEDFYQYDINFYKEMDVYGMGWEMFAADDVRTGALSEHKITSLEPDTEYTIYVYGVNTNDYSRITSVVRTSIKTLAPVKVNANFKIDVTAMTATSLNVTFSTTEYDGYFVAKLYKNAKPEYTDADVVQRIEDYWLDEVQTSGWIGYTPEQIIAEHGSKSTKTVEYTNLEPNKRYYLYVFAIDETALRCSDVTFKSVVTPEQ